MCRLVRARPPGFAVDTRPQMTTEKDIAKPVITACATDFIRLQNLLRQCEPPRIVGRGRSGALREVIESSKKIHSAPDRDWRALFESVGWLGRRCRCNPGSSRPYGRRALRRCFWPATRRNESEVVIDAVVIAPPRATRRGAVRGAATPTVAMPSTSLRTRSNDDDLSRVSRTSPIHSERGARDGESNPVKRCRIRRRES